MRLIAFIFPCLVLSLTPYAVCLFFKYPLNLFMCRHVVNVLRETFLSFRLRTKALAHGEQSELLVENVNVLLL